MLKLSSALRNYIDNLLCYHMEPREPTAYCIFLLGSESNFIFKIILPMREGHKSTNLCSLYVVHRDFIDYSKLGFVWLTVLSFLLFWISYLKTDSVLLS